jgi:hypothetical protein
MAGTREVKKMWYVWVIVAVAVIAVLAVAASRTIVAMRRRPPSPEEIDRGKGTQPQDNYGQWLDSQMDAYRSARLDTPAKSEDARPDKD